MSDKKLMIILVGPSYSGKTTFRKKHFPAFECVSFDDIIHSLREEGQSYEDSWHRNRKRARNLFNQKLLQFIEEKKDFVIDATHLTEKSRARKINYLNKTRSEWSVVYIVFDLPVNPVMLAERVISRKDQPISLSTLITQLNSYEPPTPKEGADFIIRDFAYERMPDKTILRVTNKK